MRRSAAVVASFMFVVGLGEKCVLAEAIYWVDRNADTIQRANLDGTDVETVVGDVGAMYGIALDAVGGKVYWTNPFSKGVIDPNDPGFDKILRANLDGTEIETLVNHEDLGTVYRHPHGIALDLASEKMYWADTGADKIQRANLDGSEIEDLVTTGLQSPEGIALDSANAKMYWSDFGTDKIQRANLDGSGVEDVVVNLNSIGRLGLALDLVNDKMYFTYRNENDRADQRIQCAGLDGGDLEDVLSVGTSEGIALDVSSGNIYWADDFGAILRANLDGSEVEQLLPAQDSRIPITGVALDLTPIPEPSTLVLLAMGSVAVLAYAWRRKQVP